MESASESQGNDIILDTSHTLSVPLDIFQDGLSGLEAITKYLKEQHNLRLCEIAKLLSRDDRTIWGAYADAQKKMPGSFTQSTSSIVIPLTVFAERRLSILESSAMHLKEHYHLRLCQIAAMLNKDQRTIWTVCHRAGIKRNNAG